MAKNPTSDSRRYLAENAACRIAPKDFDAKYSSDHDSLYSIICFSTITTALDVKKINTLQSLSHKAYCSANVCFTICHQLGVELRLLIFLKQPVA